MDENEQFCLILPVKFISFQNKRLMELAERAVAYRLVNLS